jgi:hypothetical protein
MKRTVAAMALALAIASCGSDTAQPDPDAVIDRTTFVETYVDLRWETVHTPDFRLTPEARDEILARHGVRSEDLVRFAEVHGRDLELMNEVWAAIEAGIQERQSEDEN